MMNTAVSTIIDREQCTGCGLCVKVCPFGTITMEDGKAAVTGDRSLNCGHCAAVCPVDAVQVTSIDQDLSHFSTFEPDHRWLPYGEFDSAQLIRLMASRRSCRNYKDTPVDRSLLEDLVKIGVTAPSGTNCQGWTFTILPTRDAVTALGARVAGFYAKLNRLAEKRFFREFLKVLGKKELANYYRDYYEYVEQGLAEWKKSGRDPLFYHAPAAMVIAQTSDATLPKEDSMLASQNILLAAHSMGLGTCLIGMAVEAMKRDKGIQRFLGIPDRETVYSVIAVGYPNEKYHTQAGRKKVPVRYFQG